MKPDYEMLRTMIDSDIEQIQKANSLLDTERLLLFQQIMATYAGIIENLYAELYGVWTPNGHKTINYTYLSDKPEAVSANLKLLLRKLQTAKIGFGLISMEQVSTTSTNKINIQNNFAPSISFEQACSEMKNIKGLTDEQKNEAIDKIKEIEEASQNLKTDKARWEKIKPILVWLGNSSFELAKVILPLIIKS